MKFKEMSTPEQVTKDIDKKMNSMKSRWCRFVNGLKTPASKGVATVCLLLAGLSVVNPIALPVSAFIASVYLIVKWKEAHDDYKAMLIRRNESQNTQPDSDKKE